MYRKGEGTTFPVSLKELSTCSCFRKGISDEERGSELISGDAGSPGVIGAVVPQGVNGNVWHAPDDGTEEHSNGNKLDGGTLGEQGAEGLESNGAVLPCSERAARRRVDETGETEALVNMLGSSTECTTPPRDIL